jgi:hypothetical protein
LSARPSSLPPSWAAACTTPSCSTARAPWRQRGHQALTTTAADPTEKSRRWPYRTCETDTFAGARATGSITNTSDKNQGFQINLRFETEDGVLIAEQPHFTDTINVGQSQPWNITTFQDVPEGASLTCEVSSVRYTIFDDETRNN